MTQFNEHSQRHTIGLKRNGGGRANPKSKPKKLILKGHDILLDEYKRNKDVVKLFFPESYVTRPISGVIHDYDKFTITLAMHDENEGEILHVFYKHALRSFRKVNN